mmetsp:Transcript_6275/g.8758  ORF Transcript_6275/g.8758 Transcript_6275/m.8758 type:complete len:208 (-) Transcript_6275:68-691(-)
MLFTEGEENGCCGDGESIATAGGGCIGTGISAVLETSDEVFSSVAFAICWVAFICLSFSSSSTNFFALKRTSFILAMGNSSSFGAATSFFTSLTSGCLLTITSFEVSTVFSIGAGLEGAVVVPSSFFALLFSFFNREEGTRFRINSMDWINSGDTLPIFSAITGFVSTAYATPPKDSAPKITTRVAKELKETVCDFCGGGKVESLKN